MKILLANNYYGSSAPSGESLVVDVELDLLKRNGHSVTGFFRHSDELRQKGVRGSLLGALSTPWNPFSARAIREAVDLNIPDIVHAHNTFPLLSPSIFPAIGGRAAKVLTLHNYRLFCAAAIPLRNRKPCTRCIDEKSVMPALRYGCYRGSRLATAPLAASVALHRKMETWSRHVDAFITLSEFQRNLMIAAGLPAELVHVKPNFYPGNPSVLPWNQRRDSIVFAGRLTAEKGVEALVNAWLAWGPTAPELRIIGDGEQRERLEALSAKKLSVPIRFLGQLASSDARSEIASAKLLVLPSECYEGFPMVIGEAFAFGTPPAVSNIGPLPGIVSHQKNGLVFDPGRPLSLLKVIRSAWESPDYLLNISLASRKSFEDLYTEEVNYRQLIAIYKQAIEVKQTRVS